MLKQAERDLESILRFWQNERDKNSLAIDLEDQANEVSIPTSINHENYELWIERVENNKDACLSLGEGESIKLYRDKGKSFDRSIEVINIDGRLQVLISTKERRREGGEKSFKPKLMLLVEDESSKVFCERVVEGQMISADNSDKYQEAVRGIQRPESGHIHTTKRHESRKVGDSSSRRKAASLIKALTDTSINILDESANPMHFPNNTVTAELDDGSRILLSQKPDDKDPMRHIVRYGGREVYDIIDPEDRKEGESIVKVLRASDLPYLLDQVGRNLAIVRDNKKVIADFKTQNLLFRRDDKGMPHYTVIDDWPQWEWGVAPEPKVARTPGISCPPCKPFPGWKLRGKDFFTEDTGLTIEGILGKDAEDGCSEMTMKTNAFYDSYAYLLALCAMTNPDNLVSESEDLGGYFDCKEVHKEIQGLITNMLKECYKLRDKEIDSNKSYAESPNLGNISGKDGPFSIEKISTKVAEKIPNLALNNKVAWLKETVEDSRRKEKNERAMDAPPHKWDKDKPRGWGIIKTGSSR